MTHTILTLGGSNTQAKDRDSYTVRRAVRAVVMDTDGSVALLHARALDYFKLPGGGIEDGEDIPSALAREAATHI